MTIDNKIICAVSTAPGTGGIAIVRVSGKGAIQLVDKIFQSPAQKKLADQTRNTIHYGHIIYQNSILDEVLVSVFHAPNSFTGEDSIEIACHGSLYIQQNLMQALIEQGATPARGGEFTQRAFMNGKMDLSQAEAVADLIASTSAMSHRIAMHQMRGGISDELTQLRTQLLNFASLIELELDFSEEDVEFADRAQLKQLLASIKQHLHQLISSFKLGNAIKTGVPVAIIGETNTGKSTLLNLLLKDEKAIVSDIHGTTRDVIEDTINIQGITFRLIDTAGIRKTSDSIEAIGIERSFKKIEQASIVLWVIDAETSDDHTLEMAQKILPLCNEKKLILIFNKTDMIPAERKQQKQHLLQNEVEDRIFISAKYNEGINQIENKLIEVCNLTQVNQQDVIITNARHADALQKAADAVVRIENGLGNHLSGDFIAQDIRECIYYLGEITGDISTDEILGNIFSKFCIGK